MIDTPVSLSGGNAIGLAVGGGAIASTTLTWWNASNGTGVNAAWRNLAVPQYPGMVRFLDGPNNFEVLGFRTALQLVSLIAARPATTVNAASVRCRVDMLCQVATRGGIPANGMRIGLTQGNQSSSPFTNNSFVSAEVSSAGLYASTKIHRQAGGGDTITPIAGAVDATVPHVFSIELINADVNKLKFQVNGATIFESVTNAGEPIVPPRSGALITELVECGVERSGDAGIVLPAAWVVYSTRVRYDFNA